MSEVFPVHQTVRCAASFSDENQAPFDPTSVTFKLRSPDGDALEFVYGTDAELMKDDVGEYHVDYEVQQPGLHHYRFEGVGDLGPTAKETRFFGQSTSF